MPPCHGGDHGFKSRRGRQLDTITKQYFEGSGNMHFDWFFGSIFGIVVLVFSIALYFLPTIVAVLRHHRNALAVFLVNLFFGWTGIGWIIALIWSVMR